MRRLALCFSFKQINAIKTLSINCLSGGRDKRGGPILQFPSESRVDDMSVEDVSTCLSYLSRLPRCVI